MQAGGGLKLQPGFGKLLGRAAARTRDFGLLHVGTISLRTLGEAAAFVFPPSVIPLHRSSGSSSAFIRHGRPEIFLKNFSWLPHLEAAFTTSSGPAVRWTVDATCS